MQHFLRHLVDDRRDRTTAERIFCFVQDEIWYGCDESLETGVYNRFPHHITRHATCGDYASLLFFIFDQAGFDCSYCIVKQEYQSSTHALVWLRLDEGDFAADCSEFGTLEEIVSGAEFQMVLDKQNLLSKLYSGKHLKLSDYLMAGQTTTTHYDFMLHGDRSIPFETNLFFWQKDGKLHVRQQFFFGSILCYFLYNEDMQSGELYTCSKISMHYIEGSTKLATFSGSRVKYDYRSLNVRRRKKLQRLIANIIHHDDIHPLSSDTLGTETMQMQEVERPEGDTSTIPLVAPVMAFQMPSADSEISPEMHFTERLETLGDSYKLSIAICKKGFVASDLKTALFIRTLLQSLEASAVRDFYHTVVRDFNKKTS